MGQATRRRTTHYVYYTGQFSGPAKGWKCSCGQDSERTKLSAEEHQQRVAKTQLAQMDTLDKSALVCFCTWNGDLGDKYAVEVARAFRHESAQFPGLLVGPVYGLVELLLPYTRVTLDDLGSLRMRVEWERVHAALEGGEIAADEEGLVMLRAAASMAGYGMVPIGAVWRQLAPHNRQVLMEGIRKLAGDM